jgi:diaminohydroxyphosphoribosylaminopyrimidine deaminase/5-amino-6-(5-phosphoribosylamino)uracil reductase
MQDNVVINVTHCKFAAIPDTIMDDLKYMHRCLELAKLGAGAVAPNPMVGAVLVHEDRIIGEGYHREYGKAHAEVNCVARVGEEDRKLIPASTLYVSLEPCSHFGKTPPCTDLIIREQIPRVVVGCRDPFKEVAGKGIEKLRLAGCLVTVGVLERECKELNKRFLTFHTAHRPYVILKWAQTANGKIGSSGNERLLITNAFTDRYVHKWRSQEMGILIGTNTALLDNPRLTNRLWNGKSPVRLVVDMHLRLPPSLKIFDGEEPTVVFNALQHNAEGAIKYYQVTEDVSIVHQILNACYEQGIQSIIVEGGARALQSFIDGGIWDEARVITNETLNADKGLPAPEFFGGTLVLSENIFSDRIDYYYNKSYSY